MNQLSFRARVMNLRLRLKAKRTTHILLNISSAILSQSMLVITGIVAARLLGPSDRGSLAILTLAPVILSLFAEFGVPSALSYFLSQDPVEERTILHRVYPIILAQIVIATAVLAVVFWKLGHNPQFVSPVSLALLAPAAIICYHYEFAILQSRQQFGLLAFARALPQAAYACFVLLLLLLSSPSVGSFLISWLLALVVAALTLVYFLRRAAQSPARGGSSTGPDARTIMSYGLRGFLGTSAPLDTLRIDQVVVAVLLPTTQVGLYVVAFSLTTLTRFVSESISQVSYPLIASSDSSALARQRTRQYALVSLAAAGTITAVLVLAAPTLLSTLFGTDYVGAVTTTRILLLAAFLNSMRRYFSDALRAQGNPLVGTWAELLSLLVFTVASFAFTTSLGIEGTALGLLIAAVAAYIPILGFFKCYPKSSIHHSSHAARTKGAPVITHRQRFNNAASNYQMLNSRVMVPTAGAVLLAIIVAVAITSVPPYIGTIFLLSIVALVTALMLLTRANVRELAAFSLTVSFLLMPLDSLRLSSSLPLSDLPLYAAAALALAASVKLSGGLQLASYRGIAIGMFFLAIGGITGAFFSSEPQSSLVALLKLVLAVTPTVFTIAFILPTAQEIHRMLVAYIAGVALSSLVAFIEPRHIVTNRADGLALDANHLGLTILLAIGPLVVMVLSYRRFRRIFSLSALSLLFGALLISGGRAAFLGAVFAVLVVLWLFNLRKLVVGLVVTGFSVGSLLLITGFQLGGQNGLSRLLLQKGSGAQSSDEDRVVLLRSTWSLMRDHLITGTGFLDVNFAHNLYLQIWQASGIIGILGLGLIVWNVVLIPTASLMRSAPSTTFPSARTLSIGIVASFYGFLLSEMAQNALRHRYIWAFAALSIAAYVASLRPEERFTCFEPAGRALRLVRPAAPLVAAHAQGAHGADT